MLDFKDHITGKTKKEQELERENKLLKAQLQANSARVDFQEEVITEIIFELHK